MPDVTIRPVHPEDCTRVMELVRELAVFEKLEDILTATEQKFEQAFFGDSPTAEAIVAEVDSVIVGYAVFFHNFSTFLARQGTYLEDIYVQPDHRGSGIGSKLIQGVARIAVERGSGRFEWCVLDWNVNAINFYRNLGADILDEWRIVRLDEDGLRKLAATDSI